MDEMGLEAKSGLGGSIALRGSEIHRSIAFTLGSPDSRNQHTRVRDGVAIRDHLEVPVFLSEV